MTTVYDGIFDRNILELAREFRLSYFSRPSRLLHLLGLTGIVGTFFVKDYLGRPRGAGSWGRSKCPSVISSIFCGAGKLLVYFGAGVIAVSLLIMVGLIGHREAMTAMMPAEIWYVVSVLLAPIGYVIQDTVADAMTVEAVPRIDEKGQPIGEARLKLMHTTMQTLGGGHYRRRGSNYLPVPVHRRGKLLKEQIAEIYRQVYLMALVIPAVSVLRA